MSVTPARVIVCFEATDRRSHVNLRTAHLGEVSVTVWPQILKEMCARRDIHVLE